MDKDKHMKKAAKFAKEKAAYIHCECDNGITQLAVTGDPFAITYGCYRTLQRTTELTGIPFNILIQTLEDIHDDDKAIREDLK